MAESATPETGTPETAPPVTATPAALASTPQEDAAKAARAEARQTWLKRFGLAVVVLAALWTGWYVLFGRNSVSTDNAYVSAELAQVTPLMSSTVTAVHVRDTQAVKKGDVLVELDPADADITLAQAEADLAAARRRFRQMVATGGALSAQVAARASGIAQAQAQLDTARADLARAQTEMARRQALVATGAVSGEELTLATRNLAAARAATATAEAGVAAARAGEGAARGELAANSALTLGVSEETDPGVLAAKARLASARLGVGRGTIRAPMDGIVTRRQVQVGQRVALGVPIMTIVPVGQLYIDANFKERQLRRVKIGMPATVVADIYGSDVVYHGKVVGIGGSTGAAMALIPAQNATGNWIKVVQRLPVRIELDPRELAAHPLRLGLSTEVEIDLSGN